MTLQEELSKLEKQQQEKRKELETKYAIVDALGNLPEGYAAPGVHVYSLYGSDGSIKFAHNYYRLSTDKGKQPDAELLRALLSMFPPTGKTRVKDGCLSFRPSAHVSKELEARSTECLDVCPVTVDIETYQHQTASFEWFAELGGGLWRFEVEIDLYSTDLGTLHMRAERDQRGNVIEYTECNFHAKHDAQVVKWGRGGPEYPNKFTLWWDVDTGKGTDFPALAVRSKHEREGGEL